MALWQRGTDEVEALLESGALQKLTGAAANGERLMRRQSTTVQTARSVIETDPDSAFVLASSSSR